MVIQRWQSVALLLTVALMACFSFLSLGTIQTPDYTFNFSCLGFNALGTGAPIHPEGYPDFTWFLFIVAVMSAILPFITIFMYKNLKLQKQLCLIEIMFILCAICLAGWEGYRGMPGYSCSWSSLALAPFLALIIMVAAWQLINKDHKLLKSVDRIR